MVQPKSRILVADNSGPSWTFNGELDRKFAKKFMEWLHEEFGRLEASGPRAFDVSADGETEVEYEVEGNYTNNVTVSEKRGRFTVRAFGDGEELEVPPQDMFVEGHYQDDNGENYTIVEGEVMDLETVKQRVKEANRAREAAQNKSITCKKCGVSEKIEKVAGEAMVKFMSEHVGHEVEVTDTTKQPEQQEEKP